MSLTNRNKPTSSFANRLKVSIGETWASITSTWATETRTWEAVSQLISNSSLEGITYLWAFNSLPWSYQLPWQVSIGINNIAKP